MEVPNRIRELLAAHGAELAGELVANPGIPNGIYLPLRLSRDTSGRQLPSHRDLANLRSDLAGAGFSAEFLLIDREARSLEDSLRASLISSFPELVRNSFLTMTDGAANIWVDNKREISDEDAARITSAINEYRKLSSFKRFKVHFITEESLATNTEILALIRKLAPVGCDGIESALSERGFSVPSLDWINRKFDAMRKAGLVVRLSNGTYVLTAHALHRLGTLKNRHSPDISRLLALARRRG